MVVVPMMNRKLAHIPVREFPRAATADPRIELQRLLAVALRALIGSAARIGHDAIQLVRVTRLHVIATLL
jgi:hypothetical protein